MSWTNAADFTFTGLKFRLNGYRWSWVSDTIKGGAEGAIEHQQLATLARLLSVRVRSIVAQGTKAASDPNLSEATASPVTTSLIGPIDVYLTGPIGEHVGIWSDLCAYHGSNEVIGPTLDATCARSGGYIGLTQLAAQVTTTFNGNTLGFAGTLVQAGRAHTFMGMTPATAPNHQPYAPGIGSADSLFTSYGVYAFLADRVGLKVSVEPSDNPDDNHLNYRVEGGVFALNSDAGWLLLGWTLKRGSDMTPVLTGVPGVTALTKGQLGYTSASTAQARRSMYSLGYGFTDRGPHSFVATVNLSTESDEYTDGGTARMRAVGTNLRYYFQHRYGADFYVYNYDRWEYADPTGVTHPIPQNTGLALRLVYSPVLYLSFYIEAANTQSTRLDQDWRNGNYWAVNIQFAW